MQKINDFNNVSILENVNDSKSHIKQVFIRITAAERFHEIEIIILEAPSASTSNGFLDISISHMKLWK